MSMQAAAASATDVENYRRREQSCEFKKSDVGQLSSPHQAYS